MKRKVFQPKEPRTPLTEEECIELGKEADRYYESVKERLDRLDNITAEDLKTIVKEDCHGKEKES